MSFSANIEFILKSNIHWIYSTKHKRQLFHSFYSVWLKIKFFVIECQKQLLAKISLIDSKIEKQFQWKRDENWNFYDCFKEELYFFDSIVVLLFGNSNSDLFSTLIRQVMKCFEYFVGAKSYLNIKPMQWCTDGSKYRFNRCPNWLSIRSKLVMAWSEFCNEEKQTVREFKEIQLNVRQFHVFEAQLQQDFHNEVFA